MSTIELLGGAFVYTFEKGEKGKPGKWSFLPTFRKPAEQKKRESLREQPQFALQTTLEQAAVKRYQGNLRTQAIDITKFLNTLVDAK